MQRVVDAEILPRRTPVDVILLARLLDDRWVIPGLGVRFGLDAVLGLVPVVGDGIALAMSAWIVVRAVQLGAPATAVAHMVVNLAIDGVIGVVPVVGDIADVAWRANRRNLAILRRHLGDEPI